IFGQSHFAVHPSEKVCRCVSQGVVHIRLVKIKSPNKSSLLEENKERKKDQSPIYLTEDSGFGILLFALREWLE
ncbi:hypothetical protein AVEN_174575-1, partial [Araneus ventricosus]